MEYNFPRLNIEGCSVSCEDYEVFGARAACRNLPTLFVERDSRNGRVAHLSRISAFSPAQHCGCPILRVLCEGWDSLRPPYQCSVLFPSSGSPLRLDLHRTHLPRCVVQKAGPWPVFRPRHKTALDRVAVHVSQLFHALQLVVHVEVVVSPLPELNFSPPRFSFLEVCCFRTCSAVARDDTAGSPTSK